MRAIYNVHDDKIPDQTRPHRTTQDSNTTLSLDHVKPCSPRPYHPRVTSYPEQGESGPLQSINRNLEQNRKELSSLPGGAADTSSRVEAVEQGGVRRCCQRVHVGRVRAHPRRVLTVVRVVAPPAASTKSSVKTTE